MHHSARISPLPILLLIAVWGASSGALAAPVTYFGHDDPRGTMANVSKARDAFQASLSSFGVETFESYAAFAVDPKLAFGATGITGTSDASFIVSSATYAAGGTKSLLDSGPTTPTGAPFNDYFLLSQPVTAFGLFIANVGDAVENSISLLLENTLIGPAATRTVQVATIGPGTAQNNILFVGVTDTDSFNKVSVLETTDYDGTMYDNITVGFVVPEPSSLVLAGLGASCAGWIVTRRRVRSSANLAS